MAILPLVIAPDPRLKAKSEPIAVIDDSIRTLAMDMLVTMYHEHGIGLAAVQVGVLKRLLVADVTWREGEGPGKQYVLINPEIVDNKAEPHSYKEGCLSFPDQFVEVTRPESVRIRYQDLSGETKEETFDGLLATCILHEIDHLNGVTLVDYVSSVKRDMMLRKLSKLKRSGAFDHDHSNCGHDHGHGHHHHHDHEEEHVHGEHCNH